MAWTARCDARILERMRGSAALLVVLLGCAGAGNGLKNDGLNNGRLQEGCDHERIGSPCSGLGYDDIGIVVGGAAAIAFVVIAKLVQR